MNRDLAGCRLGCCHGGQHACAVTRQAGCGVTNNSTTLPFGRCSLLNGRATLVCVVRNGAHARKVARGRVAASDALHAKGKCTMQQDSDCDAQRNMPAAA